jgi:predicted dehydrogenase
MLFYLGVHDADALQWVTGCATRRVFSGAVAKLMPSLGVASEDAILSVVEFEGGAVGQLANGWTRREDDPVGIDCRLEVFGTEGTVEVDVRDHGVRVFGGEGLQVPDGLHWPAVQGRIRGDLAAEVGHFVRAVRHDEEFLVSVGEALRAVAVNDAILRSVESGRPEEVEPVAV